MNTEKLLIKALVHLRRVCDHADQDCPEEYRSKWFNTGIQDAYDFQGKCYRKLFKELGEEYMKEKYDLRRGG